MGKFAIECPRCGTVNQASTFIFAKKTIKCGHCKEEFKVSDNRITSRRCPSCLNVFLFDQKNEKNACPICNTYISAQLGKMVSLPCPECGCIMELSQGVSRAECAVCDAEVDVAKALAKAKLVGEAEASVIKYEGEMCVWKHPIEDFNSGSQLIVHETQEAIFLLNGQALDTFGPGKYTLDTENWPFSRDGQKDCTGKQKSFHAEVYFINQSVETGFDWGVGDISFREPTCNACLKIGISGKMNLRVSDSRRVLIKLVGTKDGLSYESDEGSAKSLRKLFMPFITSTAKSCLPRLLKKDKIEVLDISENLDVIAKAIQEALLPNFEEYGFTISNILVTAVALPPEEDPTFQAIKRFSEQKLKKQSIENETELRMARQSGELRVQEGSLGFDAINQRKRLARAETDAAIRAIEAASEAEAIKKKGEAEAANVAAMGAAVGTAMEAQGYTKKDEFVKDVQIARANAVAQLGGSENAAITERLVDATGAYITEDFTASTFENERAQKATAEEQGQRAEDAWTCVCGHVGNTEYCPRCGKRKPQTWRCGCGTENKWDFCENCGATKPKDWDCPSCKTQGNKGRFCPNCGFKRESADDAS